MLTVWDGRAGAALAELRSRRTHETQHSVYVAHSHAGSSWPWLLHWLSPCAAPRPKRVQGFALAVRLPPSATSAPRHCRAGLLRHCACRWLQVPARVPRQRQQ
eukprot:364398-Chlamydomonas_euryale.AAC.14